MFRMRAAGYRGPEIFPPRIVRQITKAASGLTRRVNLIADKALLAAFSENTHTIRARHIRAALHDTEFGNASRFEWPWRYSWIGVALIGGTVLGASLYAIANARFSSGTPSEPVTARAPAPLSTSAEPHRNSVQSAVGVQGAPVIPTMASLPAATVDAPQAAPIDRAPARASSADLIADRIQATRRWMQSGLDRSYSIQLLATTNEEQLRNDLNALPRFIEINDIDMYRSGTQGRAALNVLWRSFNSRQAAQLELQELPASLRSNRPYVRTLQEIRAEAARYNAIR
jgi:septal ring-binding cell division protein DamX